MKYLICGVLIFLLACSGDKKSEQGERKKLHIVTTTGMIRDAVQNIVKDSMTVEALMGPGVDPHLYKATQGDLSKLNKADIIFYNGLHLEGKMSEVMEKLGRQKTVLPVSNGLPKERIIVSGQFQGNFDPHIWFDVNLWKGAVQYIADEVSKKDPANAAFYSANVAAYLLKLDSLDKFAREKIAEIPGQQRILITAHDAFSYFGRAYNNFREFPPSPILV
jgi:manganese/zinc/iron transport system substrate-binding protein